MKVNLKILLPIVLAALLPLLSIVTSDVLLNKFDFITKWCLSALMLYFLWHTISILRNWWSMRKKWLSISVILAFLILLALVFYHYGLDEDQIFNSLLLIRLMFISLIFFLIQHTLWSQEKITHLLLDKEQLQTENLRIQLTALRNQMDPHFFFNSLNTLRSMVRHGHENSEQFIIGLSDLYRQILKFQENVTLPLSKELAILNSYVFIMKNRNENALLTDFEAIDEAYKNYEIPSLALQSVLENCFKHNIMSTKMPLSICIRTTDDAYIVVRNNIQAKLSPPESTGMGLELLKKRYELLGFYDGLITESSEEVFIVKLKLIPPK